MGYYWDLSNKSDEWLQEEYKNEEEWIGFAMSEVGNSDGQDAQYYVNCYYDLVAEMEKRGLL